MKIALMTNNYKPFIGGVPISVERLKLGLERLGHEVTVFAPTYHEQTEEENVVRYRSVSQHFIGGIVLPNPFDLQIEAKFREGGFDVIHVHHPVLIGRTAVYLSQKYHVPLVFTYHTRYEQYLSYAKPVRILEKGSAGQGRVAQVEQYALKTIREKLLPAYLKTFLRHCDGVIAPTEGIRRYLQDTYQKERIPVTVIPTGISMDKYEVGEERIRKVREKTGTADKPMILSVSRLASEKNIEFLLDSIALFKQQSSMPFRFVLVGDGPGREAYEEKCRKLNIQEDVLFMGKVENDEIAPYYAAADLFIFASKTETQGIVILEAFAGKTPVVALDASGVSDLVEDGRNGYLCPEETPYFAGKMMDILNHKERKKILSMGAAFSAGQYREEEVAVKAVRLYNRVVGDRERVKNPPILLRPFS